MKLDRRDFFAKLGGAAAVAAMTHEARADALEHYLMAATGPAAAASGAGATSAPARPAAGGDKPFPTAAEIETEIETRPSRKGVGNLFTARNGNVKRLPPLPAKPTLIDYFNLRFTQTSNHCLQSANRAMKNGMSEEIILACLLHDTVQELIKVDHGWWGAQMYEPYVSPKVTFAIRYHQALRFYEDKDHGYEYPDLYRRMFGVDYKPEPYIEQTWQKVRKHKWYLEPRMVTVNDLYAFDPNVHPTLEQFTDLIGRNFKQPKDGLGFDDSPVAHMWRSIGTPDHPL
jgi:predicted HD phosphohydrolase